MDVRKRSAQQLLSIKTGSLVPADAAKKIVSPFFPDLQHY